MKEENGRFDGILASISNIFSRYWFFILVAVALLLIYRGWFHSGVLTFGDWRYLTRPELTGYFRTTQAWDPMYGLGEPNIYMLWMFVPRFVAGFFGWIGLSWGWAERIVYYFPAPIIAFASSYYLGKTVFKNRLAACSAAAVFTFNTYFLKMTTEGMNAMAAGFAMAPLTLALLIKAVRGRSFKYALLASLSLLVQSAYDLRFGYVTIAIALAGWLIYAAYSARDAITRRLALKGGGLLLLVLAVFGLGNAYWVLPAVAGKTFSLPSNYGEAWWIPILSFDKLTNALAFHYSKWTNLTLDRLVVSGASKINPFFVLIPLVAFVAVLRALYRPRRNNRQIALAGAALVIVGCLLVKGSNPPIGGAYTWLFNHVPGFNMFRCAEKFYLVIALGYALLFGLFILTITERNIGPFKLPLIKKKKTTSARATALFAILAALLLLIIPALRLSLGGASEPVDVPKNYQSLNRALESEKNFSRSFWYPESERFGLRSIEHPNISAMRLPYPGPYEEPLAALSGTGNRLSAIKSPLLPGLLDASSVRELIVPDDSEGVIFPRWASPDLAKDKAGFENLAAGVPGNSARRDYGGISVYERSNSKPHVYMADRVVGILGGWNTALSSQESGSIDLNKSAYFFSEQGKTIVPMFRDKAPVDAFIAGVETRLDAVMPFVSPGRVMPLQNAAARGVTADNGWRPIRPENYFTEVLDFLAKGNCSDRSLDYQLGAVITTTDYIKPTAGWESMVSVARTLEMGGPGPGMSSSHEGLALKVDRKKRFDGKATTSGNLRPLENAYYWRSARSKDIRLKPGRQYGVRFRMSGENTNSVHCKVAFYSSAGVRTSEKVVWYGRSGTFGFQDIKGCFSTPRDSSYCCFEVWSRENASRPSSWNLSDVRMYDLSGISKHPAVTVNAEVDQKGTYHLLARCLQWDNGGRVGAVIGARRFEVETRSPSGRVSWLDLGTVAPPRGQHAISIENLEGQNLVNAVALVTGRELEAADARLARGLAGKEYACSVDLSGAADSVSYMSGALKRTYHSYNAADATLAPILSPSDPGRLPDADLYVGDAPVELHGASPVRSGGSFVLDSDVTVSRGPLSVSTVQRVQSLVDIQGQNATGTSVQAWSWSPERASVDSIADPVTGESEMEAVVAPSSDNSPVTVSSAPFAVSGDNEYSSFVAVEGRDCKNLQVELVVLDYKNAEIQRLALGPEINGDSAYPARISTTRIHPNARFARIEVSSFPRKERNSGWKLKSILFNTSGSVAAPLSQLMLAPRGWVTGNRVAPSAPSVRIVSASPTRYEVESGPSGHGVLILSEFFTPDWVLTSGKRKVTPFPVYSVMNGFDVETGSGKVEIRYEPQDKVNVGFWVAAITLVSVICFLAAGFFRRRKSCKKRGKG